MLVFPAPFAAYAVLALLRIVRRRPAWPSSGRDIPRGAPAMTSMLTAATRPVSPDAILEQVPAALPFRHGIPYRSGLLEMLGALGLPMPRTRRAAGSGLAGRLLAVIRASLYVAVNDVHIDGHPGSALYQRVRLPLRCVPIRMAGVVPRGDATPRHHAERLASRPSGAGS
jgi:uncharacterized membrane protein